MLAPVRGDIVGVPPSANASYASRRSSERPAPSLRAVRPSAVSVSRSRPAVVAFCNPSAIRSVPGMRISGPSNGLNRNPARGMSSISSSARVRALGPNRPLRRIRSSTTSGATFVDLAAACARAPRPVSPASFDVPIVRYVSGSKATSPANPMSRSAHLLPVALPTMSPNPNSGSFTCAMKSDHDASSVLLPNRSAPGLPPAMSAPSLSPDSTIRRPRSSTSSGLSTPLTIELPRMLPISPLSSAGLFFCPGRLIPRYGLAAWACACWTAATC